MRGDSPYSIRCTCISFLDLLQYKHIVTNEHREGRYRYYIMTQSMKDLIIQVLPSALDAASYAETKNEIQSISVMDVSPIALPVFMEENGIPSDAWFSGNDNGYDGWDDFMLSWDVVVPTTDAERQHSLRESFRRRAFRRVSDLLKENGYRRYGSSTRLFKAFDDTTVYDMYMNGEIDRLVDYYSLYFKLKDAQGGA